MIKKIITCILFVGVAVASFTLGTTQTKTITKIETVTEIKEIVLDVEKVETTEYGTLITYTDGTGYYLENNN